MILAIIICILSDIVMTTPAVLLYFAAADLLNGSDPAYNSAAGLPVYIAASVLLLLLIAVTAFFKHITLMKLSGTAETGKVSERKTALIAASFTSAALFAGLLFIFDIRLALAAFWPLPFSLILYLLYGKVRSGTPLYYSDRQQLDAAVGEYLSMCAELKDNNAVDWYLERLEKKNSFAEFSALRYNRGTILFSSFARLIPEAALASVALAGAVFISSGSLSPEIFILVLLVSSRIYIPLIAALDSIKI